MYLQMQVYFLLNNPFMLQRSMKERHNKSVIFINSDNPD